MTEEEGNPFEGLGRRDSMVEYLDMARKHFKTRDELVAAAIAFAIVTQEPPLSDDVVSEWATSVWQWRRWAS